MRGRGSTSFNITLFLPAFLSSFPLPFQLTSIPPHFHPSSFHLIPHFPAVHCRFISFPVSPSITAFLSIPSLLTLPSFPHLSPHTSHSLGLVGFVTLAGHFPCLFSLLPPPFLLTRYLLLRPPFTAASYFGAEKCNKFLLLTRYWELISSVSY